MWLAHSVICPPFVLQKAAQIYIYIYNYPNFFELIFKKTVSKRRTLSELNWSLMCPQKASKAFCKLLRPSKPAYVSGIRYRRGPPTVRKRYSVRKTGSSGTRRIFKGPQNSTCRTECIFRGVPCQKQPTAAPDASSVRETAPLGGEQT